MGFRSTIDVGWQALQGESVMVESLWRQQVGAMVRGILSMDHMPSKIHHRIVVPPETRSLQSSSLQRR
jgi:predicted methyltransferase MtxX (methanogen marker protein 4)